MTPSLEKTFRSARSAVLPQLRATRGVHAVIGGMALPNAASTALHEERGVNKATHFEAVGFKPAHDALGTRAAGVGVASPALDGRGPGLVEP
jgi:hypothetical protein